MSKFEVIFEAEDAKAVLKYLDGAEAWKHPPCKIISFKELIK